LITSITHNLFKFEESKDVVSFFELDKADLTVKSSKEKMKGGGVLVNKDCLVPLLNLGELYLLTNKDKEYYLIMT